MYSSHAAPPRVWTGGKCISHCVRALRVGRRRDGGYARGGREERVGREVRREVRLIRVFGREWRCAAGDGGGYIGREGDGLGRVGDVYLSSVLVIEVDGRGVQRGNQILP